MFLKELRNCVLFITRARVIIILFSTSYIGLIFCLFFLKIEFIVFQYFLCFLSVLGFKFHAILKDFKPFYYSLRFYYYYYYYYHYYYYCYYYYYYFNFVSHFIKTIFENRRIAFVKKCLQRGFQFLKIISSKVLFTNQPSFIYKEKFGIVTKIKLVTHAISKDLKIFDYSQWFFKI